MSRPGNVLEKVHNSSDEQCLLHIFCFGPGSAGLHFQNVSVGICSQLLAFGCFGAAIGLRVEIGADWEHLVRLYNQIDMPLSYHFL